MMEPGRIMALDVGDVRTGVALSDPMQMIASPHSVVREPSLEKTIAALAQLIQETEAIRVVVGLPLDRAGQPGPQARKVQGFIERLRTVCPVEIVTQDERFSTAESQRALIAADCSRKKRKQVVDKVAAAHILQTYMDRQAAAQRR